MGRDSIPSAWDGDSSVIDDMARMVAATDSAEGTSPDPELEPKLDPTLDPTST